MYVLWRGDATVSSCARMTAWACGGANESIRLVAGSVACHNCMYVFNTCVDNLYTGMCVTACKQVSDWRLTALARPAETLTHSTVVFRPPLSQSVDRSVGAARLQGSFIMALLSSFRCHDLSVKCCMHRPHMFRPQESSSNAWRTCRNSIIHVWPVTHQVSTSRLETVFK